MSTQSAVGEEGHQPKCSSAEESQLGDSPHASQTTLGGLAKETCPSGSLRRRKGLRMRKVDLRDRFFQSGEAPEAVAAIRALATVAVGEGFDEGLMGVMGIDMTCFCEVKMMRL
jgi:hypothetical protein